MRVMAGKTVTRFNRHMPVLVVGKLILVALKAELDAGLLQHFRVVGLVRIVAGQTFACSHGRMNIFFPEQCPMTLDTQIRHRFFEEHPLV